MNRDLGDAIKEGTDLQAGIRPFTDEEHEEATKEIAVQLDTQIQQKERELKKLRNRRSGILEKDPEEALQQAAPATSELIEKAIETFSLREQGKDRPVPLPWKSIADRLKDGGASEGGLWPGLYILVGNTGSGKSQWALQAAHHAAKNGWPILYIALELGITDLMARLLGLETGIAWSRIWHGESDALEIVRSSQAEQRIAALPFRQASVPPYGWSYDRLWKLVEAMTQTHPEGKAPFVVLDFMQLVASPPEKREDLRERIQKTAYAARAVARELSSPVLLVSSTSREKYDALNGIGKGKSVWKESASFLVGFGKESGEIEYAADGVFVLAKEPWEGTEPPPGGSTVHLGIAKRRAGPASAWIPLKFDGSSFIEATYIEPSL